MPSVRFPEPGAIAPAFSRRAKAVQHRTPAGYYITRCPGCDFSPVRDVPETGARSDINMLAPCGSCERRLCVVCYPPEADCCQACSAERMRVELRGALA